MRAKQRLNVISPEGPAELLAFSRPYGTWVTTGVRYPNAEATLKRWAILGCPFGTRTPLIASG